MVSTYAGSSPLPRSRRTPRKPRRCTLAIGAAVVMCVTTALVVGIGWAVGHRLSESTAGNTPWAGAWSGTNGMIITTSETDAQTLRAQGWTLPTLSPAGYQVVDMVQGQVSGQPMVVITLDNGFERVFIIEQRGDVNPDNPVDGTTGLPVSAEGLDETAVAGTRLWVVRSTPWRAVMARQDVVYTVVSDAPPAALSRTLTLVAAEERGRVTPPGSEPHGFAATVLNGLREIVR